MALRFSPAVLILVFSLLFGGPSRGLLARSMQPPGQGGTDGPGIRELPPLPGPASLVLSHQGITAGKGAQPGDAPVWGISPQAADLLAGTGDPDPFAIFEAYELQDAEVEAMAVGVGDFNDDGRDDVVVTAGWPTNQLLLYTQSLTGTLAGTPITYTTGLAPDTLAVGDLNEDGLSDVAVANRLGDSIGVFLQLPGGNLAGEISYPTGSGPDSIAVEDLNDDGLQDVVVTHAGEAAIGVYIQEISGTLSGPTYYSAPTSSWNDLATGDYNRDGLPDVAKMNGQFSANPSLSVYTQNTTGGLDLPVPLDLGEVVGNGLAAADLTGDGWDELVLSHGGNRPFARITEISTTLSATLAMTKTHPAYDVPETLLDVDINLDGRPDILALHGGWSSLSVSLQGSAGSLHPYRRYDLPVPGAAHYGPRALASGDLNSDGLPDVAIADSDRGLVILYHRKGSKLQFFPFASLPINETTTPVFDDFGDPESGWPIIESVYADFLYQDGEYKITNHRSYVAAFATAGHRLENLDVELDGRRFGPVPGGYGVAFGFTDTIPVSEYFALIVWPDYQEWNLIRFEFEHGFETLFWGASGNINPGEVANRLRVQRNGDEITIWINGVPLFGTLYPTYSGARLIGLLQTPLEVGHEARFDNYKLTVP